AEPPPSGAGVFALDGVAALGEVSRESREALWRDAGLERDAEGLARLAGDPHPLAGLIAGSALARAESRGAHQRRDFPEVEPALDGMHVTIRRGCHPELQSWT
ncbi:MAG: hypothetical protein M3018_04395, partial [Actinomycetota bacterium]|nr:hypothetical protein [Actinomycetota bacterium]